MEEILFSCETITPMLLFGADGETPELRSPSLKGLMRFWWRAIHGNYDLPKLKEIEANIFGGVQAQATRSTFRVRFLESDTNYSDFIEGFPIVPHKSGFSKNGFKVGFPFKILIQFRENEHWKIEHCKDLFLLTSILGGIGNRSRRGFGAFKVLNINGNKYEPVLSKKGIKQLIRQINSNFSIKNSLANNSGEYPWVKQIFIGNEELKNPTKEIIRKCHLTKDSASKAYEQYVGYEKKRYASPIYVTVVENGLGKKVTLITQLYTPKSREKAGGKLSYKEGMFNQQQLIDNLLKK